MKMNIRLAQKTDLSPIQKIVVGAFPDTENQTIARLVASLFSENSHPPIQSFVAEIDNQIIGYVSYSPIFIKSNTHMTGFILAPLAVPIDHQGKGVGTALINRGTEALSNDGVNILLVYGDPAYYGRFGFQPEIARLFVPPYPLKYPFGWLGMKLKEANMPQSPIKFDPVPPLHQSELW